MRILVLSKRRYMSKDLLDDRYGRFRELPLALAHLGHSVSGLCLSYRIRDEGERMDGPAGARVAWQALNQWRLLPLAPGGYWAWVDAWGAAGPPDLVLACSDAMHALLGARVARRIGAPLAIDLYDNFESFGATRGLGISGAYRRAVLGADAVVCISRPLAGLVRDGYGYRGPLEVIENAVPAGRFRPRDREACRRALGLPLGVRLIGTAGALSRTRGIEILFQSFERLQAVRGDVHLVLAGPRDRGLSLPGGGRVHDLGLLPAERVPLVLSALDVSVICNRQTDFGNYCFPQKLYESVACGVPVVCAATGSLRELLADRPESLYVPDDAASLTERLLGQLDRPRPSRLPVPSWQDQGNRLGDFLQGVLARRRPARPA
jgi:teichuronic acid biosynthesis glycosyltransferase TuaC